LWKKVRVVRTESDSEKCDQELFLELRKKKKKKMGRKKNRKWLVEERE
jgi:hypothetical protein